MKKALITGIAGQDGSYLAEVLIQENVTVFGAVRDIKTARLPTSIAGKVTLIEWDMYSLEGMKAQLAAHEIDEIYNFAAYSSGEGMFDDSAKICELNGMAVTRILDAICQVNPKIRFCQASSSELFGLTDISPQTETSRFCPRTPYGAAKLYAHHMIDIYRRHYGLFACSAILYNHESPRRGQKFVTQKVARAAASIKLGLSNHFELGTLDASRDWGFAKDYVIAMRKMLIAERADDFIVATGILHSLRDLCYVAFDHVGLKFEDYMKIKQDYSRAPEGMQLVGNAQKARTVLGWEPSLNFKEIICMMVDHQLELLMKGDQNKV